MNIHDFLASVRKAKEKSKASFSLDAEEFSKFRDFCEETGHVQSHVLDALIREFNKRVEEGDES